MKAITEEQCKKQKYIILSDHFRRIKCAASEYEIKPFSIVSGTDLIQDYNDYEVRMVIVFSFKYPNEVIKITR